jgi:flagellar biosynthesis/type III secretory pathway protein FliH
MKITITNYDKTYSVEYDNDADVESVADMFKGLLVSMGYHPSNVDELFNTEYKWFTQEERDENMQGHKKYNYTDPDHPMYLAQEEDHAKAYNQGYAKGWDEAKHQDKVQKFQDDLYKQADDMFN